MLDHKVRERPLKMSDFRGERRSKLTPKHRTLKGKNRTLGGKGGSKITKKNRRSFMDVP